MKVLRNAKDVLEVLRNKAVCCYTYIRAEQHLKQLRNYLTESEYQDISIAFNHIPTEGKDEFIDIINKLTLKYT